jgi:hypothetical protein
MNGPEASAYLIKTLTDGMDHGKAAVGFVVTKWPGLAHRSVTIQTQSRAIALLYYGISPASGFRGRENTLF